MCIAYKDNLKQVWELEDKGDLTQLEPRKCC